MGQGCIEWESRAYEDQIDRQDEGQQAERLLPSGELRVEHPRRSVEFALWYRGRREGVRGRERPASRWWSNPASI